jgi:hypothetical protein
MPNNTIVLASICNEFPFTTVATLCECAVHNDNSVTYMYEVWYYTDDELFCVFQSTDDYDAWAVFDELREFIL